MNPEPQPMTAAKCLKLLAGRMKPCPAMGSHTMTASWPDLTDYTTRRTEVHCPLCGGTDQVPMFPTLRKECQYKDATRYYEEGRGLTLEALRGRKRWHNEGKCGCQGQGWVVAEVHLEDLLAIGFQVFGCGIIFQPTIRGTCIVSLTIGGAIYGEGETPGEALLQVIVAAVQAQEVESR